MHFMNANYYSQIGRSEIFNKADFFRIVDRTYDLKSGEICCSFNYIISRNMIKNCLFLKFIIIKYSLRFKGND